MKGEVKGNRAKKGEPLYDIRDRAGKLAMTAECPQDEVLLSMLYAGIFGDRQFPGTAVRGARDKLYVFLRNQIVAHTQTFPTLEDIQQ